MVRIPKSLQPILWSGDISKMDITKDKAYIIHQILSHGTLKQFVWLFHTYPKSDILHIFLTHPIKAYRSVRFHFIKTYILSIRSALDPRRYVENTPRIIG